MPYRPEVDRWHEKGDVGTEARAKMRRAGSQGSEHSRDVQNIPDDGRRELSRMVAVGSESEREDAVPVLMSRKAWAVIRLLFCSSQNLQAQIRFLGSGTWRWPKGSRPTQGEAGAGSPVSDFAKCCGPGVVSRSIRERAIGINLPKTLVTFRIWNGAGRLKDLKQERTVGAAHGTRALLSPQPVEVGTGMRGCDGLWRLRLFSSQSWTGLGAKSRSQDHCCEPPG